MVNVGKYAIHGASGLGNGKRKKSSRVFASLFHGLALNTSKLCDSRPRFCDEQQQYKHVFWRMEGNWFSKDRLGGGFKHQHGAFDKTGGFKHLLCSPLFGEDSHFDKYFSDGLKPPTSRVFVTPFVKDSCAKDFFKIPYYVEYILVMVTACSKHYIFDYCLIVFRIISGLCQEPLSRNVTLSPYCCILKMVCYHFGSTFHFSRNKFESFISTCSLIVNSVCFMFSTIYFLIMLRFFSCHEQSFMSFESFALSENKRSLSHCVLLLKTVFA